MQEETTDLEVHKNQFEENKNSNREVLIDEIMMMQQELQALEDRSQ